MSGKGKRLYQCDDCHEQQFIHWVELNRAAKPRCLKCGSSRLEMVSPEAVKEMLNRQQRRSEGAVGSTVLSNTIKDL